MQPVGSAGGIVRRCTRPHTRARAAAPCPDAALARPGCVRGPTTAVGPAPAAVSPVTQADRGGGSARGGGGVGREGRAEEAWVRTSAVAMTGAPSSQDPAVNSDECGLRESPPRVRTRTAPACAANAAARTRCGGTGFRSPCATTPCATPPGRRGAVGHRGAPGLPERGRSARLARSRPLCAAGPPSCRTPAPRPAACPPQRTASTHRRAKGGGQSQHPRQEGALRPSPRRGDARVRTHRRRAHCQCTALERGIAGRSVQEPCTGVGGAKVSPPHGVW